MKARLVLLPDGEANCLRLGWAGKSQAAVISSSVMSEIYTLRAALLMKTFVVWRECVSQLPTSHRFTSSLTESRLWTDKLRKHLIPPPSTPLCLSLSPQCWLHPKRLSILPPSLPFCPSVYNIQIPRGQDRPGLAHSCDPSTQNSSCHLTGVH